MAAEVRPIQNMVRNKRKGEDGHIKGGPSQGQGKEILLEALEKLSRLSYSPILYIFLALFKLVHDVLTLKGL